MECRGDNQTAHSQRQQTCRRLCDDWVEMLLEAVQTAEKETHSHHEQ